MNNNQAILLMGPTATGKTALAIKLAKSYPIEIISVDSALIYCDMDIGTAKPTLEELAQVPHHLINIMTPLEAYSVADFIKDSVRLIEDIQKRGKLPILVGGTMMYFNGLLNGISVLPESDPKIREQLEHEIELYGLTSLYTYLQEIDIVSANKINPNDKQRIMRAVEVYKISNQSLSYLQQQSHLNLASHIDFLSLSIQCADRCVLHSRINQRFQKMLDVGFLDEVIKVREKYPTLTINHTSMRCVGYYQAWQYLDGLITYSELLDQGCAATRQLAKRQSTWLRSIPSININTQDDLDINILQTNLLSNIATFLA